MNTKDGNLIADDYAPRSDVPRRGSMAVLAAVAMMGIGLATGGQAGSSPKGDTTAEGGRTWLASALTRQSLSEPEPGHCEMSTFQSHGPLESAVGQSVSVTLGIATACGANPVNAVLVIDGSASVNSNEDVFIWAEKLVEFAHDATPRVQLGIVEYDDVATAQCELTRDPALLQDCIRRITASGGRYPAAGLREAAAMLERGESADPEFNAVTREMAILIMGGPPEPDCDSVAEAADDWRRLRRRGGIEVVDLGDEPDFECGFVIGRHEPFRAEEWSRFVAEYESRAKPLTATSVDISTTLASQLRWVGSEPPLPQWADGTLSWTFVEPVPEVITLSYRVAATAPGHYDALESARARVVFASGFGTSPDLIRRVTFAPAPLDVWSRTILPILSNGR